MGIEIWEVDTYPELLQMDLIEALDNALDDRYAAIYPDQLLPHLMIFFHHDFDVDITITLYGKNLLCEQKDCERPPPVALFYDPMPCTDSRNPFCSAPTRCEFVGTDTTHAKEDGCRFHCKCKGKLCHGGRFALDLDPSAMKAPGELELCGIHVHVFAPGI